MGTVAADKDDAWLVKDLIRKKFVQKLDGKSVNNAKEYMGTPEAKTAFEEAKKEVEEFLGYTLEDAQKDQLKEDMEMELSHSLRNSSGEEELACGSPMSVMD